MFGWFRRKRPETPDHPFRPIGDAGESRAWSVFEKLLRDRIVLVAGMIDERSAVVTIAQLLYLAQTDATAPIRLFVNSPGGIVTSSLAIHDAMLDVGPAVETTCVGQAFGMAVLLLAAGEPGRRAAVADARVLSTRLTTNRPDDDLDTASLARTHAELDQRFRRHTGHDFGALVGAGLVNAAGAVELGIVDVIV